MGGLLKEPLITQQDLWRLLREQDQFASRCENVLSRLREGAEIEDGPLTLDVDLLACGLPRLIAESAGQQTKNWSPLLRRLLNGQDISMLRKAGLRDLAREKHRVNLECFWEILNEVAKEARGLTQRQKHRLYRTGNWSLLEDFLRASFTIRAGLWKLRLAGWLYQVHAPQAAGLASATLGTLEPRLGLLRDSARS
jgi:hypothetical protein